MGVQRKDNKNQKPKHCRKIFYETSFLHKVFPILYLWVFTGVIGKIQNLNFVVIIFSSTDRFYIKLFELHHQWLYAGLIRTGEKSKVCKTVFNERLLYIKFFWILYQWVYTERIGKTS